VRRKLGRKAFFFGAICFYRNIAMNLLLCFMGLTKVELFNEIQNEVADLFRALGHPARVAILQHLMNAPSCINADLVAETGLAQSTVSQHLFALKDAGLIQGVVSGPARSYCIHPEGWARLQQISQLFIMQTPKARVTCC
jgi:DNA-binding HxlR family transcriptional regulator